MPMTGNIEWVDVITSVQRRRRWSANCPSRSSGCRTTARPIPPGKPAPWRDISAWCRARHRSKAPNRTAWLRLSSKHANGITRGSVRSPTRPACCVSSTLGSSITIACIRTKRWATVRRESSGESSWERRPRTRSALCVDRMTARRPRRRAGQGRSRRRRWRAAPALTRAQPWTTPNNHSLSGYSGATSRCDRAEPVGSPRHPGDLEITS
jgi:hypothetical protein